MNKKLFLLGLISVVLVAGIFMFVYRGDSSDDQETAGEDPSVTWESLNKQIDTCVKAQQNDKAMSLLDDFLAKNPDFWPAMVRMSEAYISKNDLVKAEEYLTRAQGLAQPNSFLSRACGELYLKKNDYENALKHAQKSLELADSGEKGYSYATLAHIYIQMKDYKAARENIDKAIAIAPENKHFNDVLAMIQQDAAMQKNETVVQKQEAPAQKQEAPAEQKAEK
jgi:tetratricopeptide (TPR) repeat protein